MVPQSPKEELWDNDDDKRGVEFTEFNYDNEDDVGNNDDDDRRLQEGKQSTRHTAPFSGDDYLTLSTLLPKLIYHYIKITLGKKGRRMRA